MSEIVRYGVADFERVTEACPNCKTPTFIPGKGSQIHVEAITAGVISGMGHNGAVSRYTCTCCGHVWEITFPDNSVFYG